MKPISSCGVDARKTGIYGHTAHISATEVSNNSCNYLQHKGDGT